MLGDVARRSRYVAYGDLPGLVVYLFDRFVPRVRERVGESATAMVMVVNPARWLAWTPPVPDTDGPTDPATATAGAAS